MKNVLIIGSVNMDYTVYVDSFPKEGETIFGSSRNITPGGKGENQAIAIARSNKVNTDFIFAIGSDNDGEKILSTLKENKVNTFFKKCDCETGNATIAIDGKSENKIIVVCGANAKLTEKDIDIELIKKCDYVVLQNEIPQATNEFIIKQAHKLNKVVIYNPAPYRKFGEDLYSCIDYFIPNEGEIIKYSNKEDIVDGAKYLLSKGIKNVLVTLGKDGSMLINNEYIKEFPANKVKAIDTVGAGDTFVGYFVSSLASGLSIEKSIKKATLASSICVTRKGSVDSIPFGKEVF